MRFLEPLGERRLGIIQIRDDLVSQAAGSRGGPFCRQCLSARRQASW
jgi:hypothetical protein